MAPIDGPNLRDLALNVLGKTWDSARDTRGTAATNLREKPFQAPLTVGTPKSQLFLDHRPSVPPSHALGIGTMGQSLKPPQKIGTGRGTPPAPLASNGSVPVVYAAACAALQAKCPTNVDQPRWHDAKADADLFLAQWGEQAERLGWTADDLFGLHPVAPLARYDDIGLVWLLRGRSVVALTDMEAAIQTASGGKLTYYRYNKPGPGLLGDSRDEFDREVWR
jgi:hypothetical protein